MALGVPYDSREGRAIAAALTAIMCGHAYRASAEMAAAKGRSPASRRTASRCCASCACTATRPTPSIGTPCPSRPATAPRASDWDEACASARQHGYRNAQATVLAPTGTIGLLMDCDTTGIEPDFALVKFKKLAGGGYFKIVNQTVPRALRRLGYSEREVQEIVAFVSGTNTLLAAPHVNRAHAQGEGLHRRRAGEGRGGDPRRVRSRQRVRGLGHRRGRVRAPRRQPRAAQRRRASPARAPGLLARADRRGERHHHRPDDDRGRAAPARASTTRCSTARTAAARRASASSRRCRTCG